MTEFKDIATRAGRRLNCPPMVRPFAFWIHCLCKDCLESGNHAGIVGPPECRIVQGLIEKSALYCLRLAIAADEAAHQAGVGTPNIAGDDTFATAPASRVLPVAHDELHLTDAQREEIAQAEKQLDDSFRAHEEMRGLMAPSGWVGPSIPHGPTMAEDFRTLERDINEYAIKVVRVIAKASNSSGGAKTGSRKKWLKSSLWFWLLSEKPGSVDAWGLPIASIDQSHPLKTSGSWNVRTSG